MDEIFIIWQDPNSRMWEPVAKVKTNDFGHSFYYTKGALNENFMAFPRMPIKNKEYSSPTLFPFLNNRIIPSRRPEFLMILEWLDMSVDSFNPFDLLSVSGGGKQTDNFRVVKVPKITPDGKYKIRFLVSGIRYLTSNEQTVVASLMVNDRLSFLLEDDNLSDSNAILLRDQKSDQKVGYYPKYLNEDLRKIVPMIGEEHVLINVVKNNRTAPEQYRLLCEISCDWPKEFNAFASEKYEILG
jgi:hypothetical protein